MQVFAVIGEAPVAQPTVRNKTIGAGEVLGAVVEGILPDIQSSLDPTSQPSNHYTMSGFTYSSGYIFSRNVCSTRR